MAETSLISRGTVVRGNVRGSGALEIQGRVEGDVTVTGDVLLGEAGAIRGNVSGESLTILGQVQGDLRGTEAVLVERGAKVAGDLSAPKIGIATGALVRGLVRTDGEPALAAGRRGAVTGQAMRSGGSFQKSPARAEAPKPAAVEPDSEPPPAKEERKPPPPVVPALSRGTRAKKKKSREQE
ncbi:MAG TPA: polymer-forming cytoskeletal protein [Polyangiaceae bacterium]|jgi:cytoskeletal protein CcmA (bactofilin family)